MYEELLTLLSEKNMLLAVAESCTGGLIASRLTNVPGCSSVFGTGVVSYPWDCKKQLLGVSADTLDVYGAVSAETAREMANGIRQKLDADIAVSTTGFAGPDSDGDIPVGRVYVGVSTRAGTCYAVRFDFSGTRNLIRKEAARAAIDEILLLLGKDGKIK